MRNYLNFCHFFDTGERCRWHVDGVFPAASRDEEEVRIPRDARMDGDWTRKVRKVDYSRMSSVKYN